MNLDMTAFETEGNCLYIKNEDDAMQSSISSFTKEEIIVCHNNNNSNQALCIKK